MTQRFPRAWWVVLLGVINSIVVWAALRYAYPQETWPHRLFPAVLVFGAFWLAMEGIYHLGIKWRR